MYSTPIKATNKKGTKLNWWEYWIGHCWMTGWQSIHSAFKIWRDLITENFADYGILASVEDPFTECYEWFWVSLGEDDTYPKEFLEHLMEMCDRIERGEEELIPLDEDFFDRLKNLVEDVELDDDEL
jgi:hypothetical protein